MAAPAHGPASAQMSALPKLRDDLQLIEVGASGGGDPTRLVYDPLRHRYVRVDLATFELMSLMPGCATREALAAAAAQRDGASANPSLIDTFLDFLAKADLTELPAGRGWRDFAAQQKRQRRNAFSWLVHNYLFFKVPLVRPQRFLEATLHLVMPLMTRTAAMVITLIGLAGLYLVSREWDAFLSTYQHFFSLEGAVYFGLTLFVVKALHELGHAYVAVRYGCRVPALGVAFMLMTPLLYSDVTDAWRLRDDRKRLHIDSAGITVELALACVATFAWAFLPEGPAKSAAFMVATVGWVLSLAFNLNPFMRFDGYYILSDLIGIENLQSRAFAVGRWKLREVLFGLGRPCPENVSRPMRRTLVIYAWATWLYRLVLFVGIALIVYAAFFKVLGVILFVVEIAVFVAMPVWRELKEWSKMRRSILASRRTYVTGLVLLVLTALFVVPWSTRISVPAVLEDAATVRLYPVTPAKIVHVAVHQGERVRRGDPIVTLRSSSLEKQKAETQAKIDLVRMRIARKAVDEIDRDSALVLARELTSLRTRLSGLEARARELVVRAPMSGVVLELNRDLHPGRHVAATEHVATIAARDNLVASGYVSEADLARLDVPAAARFIPEDALLASRNGTLSRISTAGASEISLAGLASTNGGAVAVEPDADGRLVPVSAQFLVRVSINGEGTNISIPGQTVRGVVYVSGRPESLLARLWRQILKVLVRESGA